MGKTYRFLSLPGEPCAVVSWFRALADPQVEQGTERHCIFWFRDLGPLDAAEDSPIVNVFLPQRKRGVLTTVGEVHFLATPLSKFPRLQEINRQFRKWLQQLPCVFAQGNPGVHDWDYYLEGSIGNLDPEIYAFSTAMAALAGGAYFVSDGDNDYVLDLVCQQLALRGVEDIVAK